MKIIFIHNLYTPYERGGAERVVRQLAQAAATAGHQVKIITTAPQAKTWEVDGLSVQGLASDFANIGQWSSARRYLWQVLNLYGQERAVALDRILRHEQPDLVITNNLLGLGLACLPVAARYRHIHLLHDVQLLYPSGALTFGNELALDFWQYGLYRALSRRFTTSTKLLISPSTWLLDWHRRYGFFSQAKAVVIANPRPANEKHKAKAHEPFRLLFVGQLTSEKGVKILLSDLRLLPAGQFELLVAGAGPLADWLRNQDCPGLSYLGPQTKEQIAALMSESDCLVVPSLIWDNAPLVISEAQARKLPVIASGFSGMAEMVADKNCLFAPGDGRALAKKIKALAKNYRPAKTYPAWSATDYLEKLIALSFENK
jgi:glycosyltransferase involved in cell wall biosynthesis